MTATFCPQCKEPGQVFNNDTEPVRHCPGCKLPLVIVANKYKISHLLSEGGCGILYLSRHIKLQMDPIRVIKFIKPELCGNERIVKRLAREVEVTAALSQRSQHIVRVFDDFDNIESLGSYYVMEYLDGEDLADLLDRPPALSYRKIFHIFQQTCEAMRDAHDAGIVHRDLKPQNIFLTQRNDDPLYVKIIDFGIAKTIATPEQTKLTQGALGTPEYMSPEQCSGQEITPSSDIYAMGIILFEMIVGHTPFLPPTETNPTPTKIILDHLMTPAPLPSTIARRHVPRQLDEVVKKCLEKSPGARYQSAGELLADIQSLASQMDQRGRIRPKASSKDTSQDPQQDDDDDGNTSIESSVSLLQPWHRPLPTSEGNTPAERADAREKQSASQPDIALRYGEKTAQSEAQSEAPSDDQWTRELEVPRGSKIVMLFAFIGLIAIAGVGFFWMSQDLKQPAATSSHDANQGATTVKPGKRPQQTLTTPDQATPKARLAPIAKPAIADTAPTKAPSPQTKRQPTRRRRARRKRTLRRPRPPALRIAQRTPTPPPTPSGVPGCPPDRQGKQWVRIDVSPRGTSLVGAYPHQQRQHSFVCVEKKAGDPIKAIQLQQPGYHPCIVLHIPADRRRIQIKLQPENDGLSPAIGYCIK